MKVVTDVPYEILPIELPARSAEPSVTLIVKGSFALIAGRAVKRLPPDEQQGLCGDTPFMDDIGRSLRVSNDLVPFKPHGEVTVTAEAWAPGGVPVPKLDVGIAVGAVRKALRVFGDRAWVPDVTGTLRLQGPRTFLSMPLRWERSFGGMAQRSNPMGRGLDLWPEADGRNVFYLANVESPMEPVVGPQDRPPPSGFAPIPPNWEPRRGRVGTQDTRWVTFRAPLPPLDFDPCHFQAASEDQWIDGYWNGDEAIRLFNLDPVQSPLVSALPGVRVRAFAHRERPLSQSWIGQSEDFVEIPLKLDTVHIDAIDKVVLLTWRGSFVPLQPKGKDVIALFVAEEPLASAPASLRAHYDAYVAAATPPPAKAPPEPKEEPEAAAPPPPPEELTAAFGEARKALVDAKVDPSVIAKFDAAGSAEGKLTVAFELLNGVIGDMERAVSGMRPTGR